MRPLTILLLLIGFGTLARADEPPGDSAPRPASELFTGQVVRLTDALARRKIAFSEDELKDHVVLETPDGELIPILADWRGRAFYQDERLRNRRVELVGRRDPGVPYLRVALVFAFDEQGQRQYVDYWCDVCAIPAFSLAPCACCGGSVDLRFQPRDLPEGVKSQAAPAVETE